MIRPKQTKPTYSVVTKTILKILSFIDSKERISKIYLQRISLFNYMIVCGIGVLINMSILTTLVDLGLGLVLSNATAIVCAFLSNWTFSVGPYGFLFDLGQKTVMVEE